MPKQYPIITLCGSTKFKDAFLFGHADGEYAGVLTDEVKGMLDDMHKAKIDLAEEIFVINKNGYIGSSTRSEIEYAQKAGKKISYLEGGV